jgi:HlyD family secretion protein
LFARKQLAGRSGSFALTGTVEAPEIDVAAEVGGRIVELHVEEGARVHKGEALALLDSTQVRLRLEGAQARLTAAQAELADLRSFPRKEDLELQQSKTTEAEVQLKNARAQLAREQRLYAAKSLPQAQLEDKVAEVHLAEQRLETARKELVAVSVGARPAQVSAAAARVEESSREVELARLELSRSEIAAPVDGVCLRRNFEQGETIQKDNALVTLIDPARLWIELAADERLHGRIVLGQPVEIRPEGGGGERLSGRVSYVADRYSFTPRNVQTRDERSKLSYRIKVQVENPPPSLKPGMFADVIFTAAEGRPHELQAGN